VGVDGGGHIDVDGASKFNRRVDLYFEIEDAENKRGCDGDRESDILEHALLVGRKVLEEIFDFTQCIISFLFKIVCSDSPTHNFDRA